MRAFLHVAGLVLVHTALVLAIGGALLLVYTGIHFLAEALR